MSTIVGPLTFEYQKFRSLETSDLVAYMEPIVNGPSIVVTAGALDRMARELDAYDEYHLVYAIELGMERMPDRFAPQAARFLAHESQSVRLAAHRNLSRLPASMLSDALIDACNQAIDRGTWTADVCDIVGRLQERRGGEK